MAFNTNPNDPLTVLNNTVVLACAASLVAGVIREIAGNDISNTISGEVANKSTIESLALQRMTKTITQAVTE